MITVQGVAINSKSSTGAVATKGDSFLPTAVNVSGKKDRAEWQTLRIYAREAAELDALRVMLAEKKSLIVRSVASLFTRTFEKDGEVRPSASFSANLRQVQAFDNESKAWLPLAQMLGLKEEAKAAA